MARLGSFKGGGIRGYITARVLQSLEEHTGKPCREVFQFVAGTSTGSLVAAAIAAGVPAWKMVDVYLNRTKEIFDHSGLGIINSDFELTTHGHLYNTAALRKVIADTLGPAAKWTINDCPIDILITAKGADQWPFYFVRDNPKNSRKYGKINLVDACVASSSAVTYFPFVTIPGVNTPLTDGGLGVTGDPVYQAVVEALYYNSYEEEDLSVVSVGTGKWTPLPPKENLLSEVKWVIDTELDATESEQPQIVKRHFKNLRKFSELDINLPREVNMADSSLVPILVPVADALIKTINWDTVLG